MTYHTHGSAKELVKAWTKGVEIDPNAVDQLKVCASMPFIYKWVAAMPDVHVGLGATIGSVIPTRGAVIPAAVGVDIGCGMVAESTGLQADDLPDAGQLFNEIEAAVPHGKTFDRNQGDKGAWSEPPLDVRETWDEKLRTRFVYICDKYPVIRTATEKNRNNLHQLGTLGGGNHFIEICYDKENCVWIMIHSGSRGIGNLIGRSFIKQAQEYCKQHFIPLPHRDLAYLVQGTPLYEDYLDAVQWAQDYAYQSRRLMLQRVRSVLGTEIGGVHIDCHHNYVEMENHYKKNVLVTRKGAIRAREGDMGIIPGSMGASSFIVRGLGNPESFHSASHGAGRLYSRSGARRAFSVEDHVKATDGVACRKDESVLDETPGAYKDIRKVMAAQVDLVEPVFELKQIVCVKG